MQIVDLKCQEGLDLPLLESTRKHSQLLGACKKEISQLQGSEFGNDLHELGIQFFSKFKAFKQRGLPTTQTSDS